MNKLQPRPDDYEKRRKSLKHLSDEELKQKFWELTEQVVEPLILLSKTHTTPAIERSVLLRMGFSSLEAKALVDKVILHQLMGKGAGHVVYRASQLYQRTVREAGLKLIEADDWSDIINSFGVTVR